VAALRHFPQQVFPDEAGGASEREQHIRLLVQPSIALISVIWEMGGFVWA
jgi:hypothetical protein